MRKLLTFSIILALMATVLEAQITIPHSFSAGTRAQSAQVNANFDALGDDACNRTGCTMTGTLTSRAIIADGNNTRDIGASGTRYANFYSVLGNFSGELDANIVDSTAGYKERSRSVAMGEWADQSFSAGHYTVPSGSWTVEVGDVTNNRYSLVGKTLFWNIMLTDTVVSGTPTELRVTLPASMVIAASFATAGGFGLQGGGPSTGVLVSGTTTGTYVTFVLYPGAWSAATTSVAAQLAFEVQ